MKRFQKTLTRLRSLLLILVIVSGQVASATGPFLSLGKASAAPICVNDSAGANDEPGQKDLTKLCVDYAGVPTTVSTTWNWDETGTNGANTMDACNLFDTDGDGNINYSVCVTTLTDPAVFQTLTTYSCGDDKIDRCTSPATPISSGTTSCAVSQVNSDPFAGGTSSPKDTQGACIIQLSTVGGASAKLVDVCSYPSSQPNADPSDCVIARNDFGKVELIKDLEPGTDPGLFNLTINGPEASDTTTVNNVGDGGTTGEVVVKEGSVVVSETAGTATALSSYNTTIVCRDLNGTGTVVGTGSPTGATSLALTFTLVEDADVVCTITNTRQQATLILQKTVVNDNGGTLTQANFPVAISGTPASWGSNSVSPASYIVSETQQPGYSASVWGGDCDTQGNVTLTNSQTKTCTITNNDIAPQLKVVKHVVNDNGGTASAGDFTMNVTGTNVSDPSFPGAEEPGTTVTINAGSYSVGEDAVTGYAGSYSADCSGTIALSQTKTCTVTNDDTAPQLTLVKQVTNDNGGGALPTAWTLNAVPGNDQYQTITGQGNATDDAQANEDYTLSETNGPNGYAASAWNCDGGTLDGSVITLDVGDDVTCTITNNDIAPRLIVIKVVTNNDGGLLVAGDFPLFVGNVSVTNGVENTSFNAGQYAVTETQQTGYDFVDYNGDCLQNGSITLEVGGVYTCTLTNDDQPAYIKVTKQVTNDDGGDADISDFSLYVDATQVTSGLENTFNANESYAVSEIAQVDGYSQVSIICLDTQTQASLGSTFTALPNQHIACTVTNDDVSPTLELVKYVVNDNGGTATVDNFQAKIDSSNAAWNSAAELSAGSYVASETVLSGGEGYTASAWSGDCAANGSVELSVGENAICYITNDDRAAKLILVKNLPNDNGGTAIADDFPVFISGDPSNWGEHEINAGTYTVSETTQYGYEASNWGQDCDSNGGVTLVPGQTKTCSITNNDIAPSLVLVKQVTNDNGGQRVLSEWNLTANGSLQTPTNLSGAGGATSGAGFKADTYSLGETGPNDYTASSWSCTNDITVTDSQITLANGQATTCTIVNDDISPGLTVTKIVLNPFGNPLLASAFPLFVDGNSVTSGAATAEFGAGSYTITETQQPGYEFTGIDGDCTLEDSIISILLSLASSYTCTITNTAIQPKLIVIKHVENDNGGEKTADDFTMTVKDNSVVVPNFEGEESPGTVVLLNEGSYTVDELADGAYTKTLGTDCSGTINIGQTKTCTITNDDIAPVLTLRKVVVSNNETRQASDWTMAATPDDGDSLSGNGEDGFVSKTAMAHMTYTLSETNDSTGDFDASDWDCTSSAGVFSNPDGINNQIRMSEGANVSCTITNTERSSITIVKDAQPDSDQEFKFTGSLGDPNEEEGPNFILVDDGQNDITDRRIFTDLESGTYTVTEPNVTGWTLESIDCVGGNDAKESERNAFIKLEPGENVTCTFVNTRDTGRIIVDKVTAPVGSTQSFNFTTTGDGYENFSLTDLQNPNDQLVETGEYSISEIVPDGWDQASVTCDNEQSPSSITLEKDETVNCTFTNQKRGEIVVTKFNDYNRDGVKDEDEPVLSGWDMTLKNDSECKEYEEYDLFSAQSFEVYEYDMCYDYEYSKTQTTGEDGNPEGITTFTNVMPGEEHTLSETLKDDWYWSNTYCEYQNQDDIGYPVGSNNYDLFVSPGETLECFVGNYSDVVLNLTKSNNRPNPTVTGDTVTYTLVASLEASRGALFDARVTDLPPAGFDYVSGSATSTKGSLTETYGSPGVWSLGDLAPGEVVTMTYQAKIAATVINGNYPDVAFAEGCALPISEEICTDDDTETNDEFVLSNVHVVDTPFVQTNVTVDSPKVLAKLVETGSPMSFTYALTAIMLMILGISTKRRNITKGGAK